MKATVWGFHHSPFLATMLIGFDNIYYSIIIEEFESNSGKV